MSYYLPQGPFIRVATGGVLNSSALEDIPGLALAVDQGTYLVKASIWGINSNAVVAKAGVALSTSAGSASTVLLTVQNIDAATNQENIADWDTETTNQGIVATADNGLIIEGTIVIDKPGTFSLQLNTGEEACTIYTSSQLILYKVA